MKKYILFTVVFAVLLSCSKSEQSQSEINEAGFQKGQQVTLHVTAGDPSTRVSSSLNGTSIGFIWQEGDKILVSVDKDSEEFNLTTGAGTTSATFTGTLETKATTFDVQYPVEIPSLKVQEYSDDEAIPHDKMLFKAEDCKLTDSKFTLLPQYAVLRLNLYGKSEGETVVHQIVVTNKNNTSETYTLNIKGGKILSTDPDDPTPFFLVVPWNTSMSFTADVICDPYVTTTMPTSDCIIKGLFTIAAGGDTHKVFTSADNVKFASNSILSMPAKQVDLETPTKVYFSSGNLYYDSSKWNFELNQYDYRTYQDKRSCINGVLNLNGGTPEGHWGSFGWVGESGNLKNTYGMSNSTSNSDYGKTKESLKNDWADIASLPDPVGDGKGVWHTLTADEWDHLLFKRSVNGGKADGYSYLRATINTESSSVLGVILYPDNYTDQDSNKTIYSKEDWETMQTAGCVFLPAAGSRYDGTKVNQNADYGTYHSSTSGTSSSNNQCYFLTFNTQAVKDPIQVTYSNRDSGRSVRLVFLPDVN